MPTDFSLDTGSQFEEDLNRARGYKPVTRKELSQAYSQYKNAGLKFGQVDKTDTDEELYNKAERTVLKWWKLQQANKKRQNHQRKEAQRDPLKGMGSKWTGVNSGGSFQGGTVGSAGSYGASSSRGLPDTAMDEEGGKGGNTYLNATEVKQVMRRLGLPDTWRPPMYATRSEENMKAWAQRTAANRDMVIRGRGLLAVYDRGVIFQVAREFGVRVDPSKVPAKYRTSIANLRKYMAGLRKSRDMMLAARREAATVNDSPVSRSSAPDIIRRTTGFQR